MSGAILLPSTVAPGALGVITLDFSDNLAAGESLTGISSSAVKLTAGLDATPAALITSAPVVSSNGYQVSFGVTGRSDQADYEVTIVCATSNSLKSLPMAVTIQVRAL